MANRINRWDIVLAYWVDSGGIGRWTDIEVALKELGTAPHCWTAGFYLGESEECIGIAASSSINDNVDQIMYIPKVALVKLQVIKKASKK
jgi:hypothetical protein